MLIHPMRNLQPVCVAGDTCNGSNAWHTFLAHKHSSSPELLAGVAAVVAAEAAELFVEVTT